jgi:hypothetical protein
MQAVCDTDAIVVLLEEETILPRLGAPQIGLRKA